MDIRNDTVDLIRALEQIAEYARRQEQLELDRGFEGTARCWRHVVRLAAEALPPPGRATPHSPAAE